MLAQTPLQGNPSFKDEIQLYRDGGWVAAYPTPLSWCDAQHIALLWKQRERTTLVEQAYGGWMVYILAGAK